MVKVIIATLLLDLNSCAKLAPPQPPNFPDTTSHVVFWRTDTIGFGGASSVRDIAIINDNDIWAVGEFYLKDSSGGIDPKLFNVLRWNGTKWDGYRLTFELGGTSYLNSAYAVIAFGPNDIWIANDAPTHWDGQQLNLVDYRGVTFGEVHRFFGYSNTDFYTVGSTGKLSHYNGQFFEAIPTGVSSFLWDITGVKQQFYIASFTFGNQIRPSGIFEYSRNQFQFLFPGPSDSSIFRALVNCFGLWMSPQGTFWALGEAFVFKPIESHLPIPGINPYQSVLRTIKGLADNDVWISGSDGVIMHFNGATWREYSASDLGIPLTYVQYQASAIKGNTVVFGGWTYSPDHAILTIGKRSM
jgi:hypothetical protein